MPWQLSSTLPSVKVRLRLRQLNGSPGVRPFVRATSEGDSIFEIPRSDSAQAASPVAPTTAANSGTRASSSMSWSWMRAIENGVQVHAGQRRRCADHACELERLAEPGQHERKVSKRAADRRYTAVRVDQPARELFGTFVWVARSKRLHPSPNLGLAQTQEKIEELISRQSLEGLTSTLSGMGSVRPSPRASALVGTGSGLR